MKKLILTPIIVGIISSTLILTACNKKTNKPFQTENQNVSYSIGYNFGASFKSQGIDLDQAVFAQGLQDAIAGKDPILNKKDMQAVLAKFQKTLVAKEVKEMNELADKNDKASKEFMDNVDKDSKKPNSKIKKLEDGLYYEVITQGSGAQPTAASNVKVNYEGSLIDGKVFDSSYARNKPITFKLNEVIPGWTKALMHMPVGSTWKLYIAPNLAYGKMAPPVIGPNQTLIFKVELLSIEK